MDDILLAILLSAAVVIAIPLSVGFVFYLYLNYRKGLISKREHEIEYRKATKNLVDTMNDASKLQYDRNYKKEWDRDKEIDLQTSLEKEKIYEEELKRDELKALNGIIPKMPKY